MKKTLIFLGISLIITIILFYIMNIFQYNSFTSFKELKGWYLIIYFVLCAIFGIIQSKIQVYFIKKEWKIN